MFILVKTVDKTVYQTKLNNIFVYPDVSIHPYEKESIMVTTSSVGASVRC